MRLVRTVLLASALLVWGCPKFPDNVCGGDGDCPAGQFCDVASGRCLPRSVAPTSAGRGAACELHEQCADGQCRRDVAFGGYCTRGCATDADCNPNADGTYDRCVDHPGGRFCARGCDDAHGCGRPDWRCVQDGGAKLCREDCRVAPTCLPGAQCNAATGLCEEAPGDWWADCSSRPCREGLTCAAAGSLRYCTQACGTGCANGFCGNTPETLDLCVPLCSGQQSCPGGFFCDWSNAPSRCSPAAAGDCRARTEPRCDNGLVCRDSDGQCVPPPGSLWEECSARGCANDLSCVPINGRHLCLPPCAVGCPGGSACTLEFGGTPFCLPECPAGVCPGGEFAACDWSSAPPRCVPPFGDCRAVAEPQCPSGLVCDANGGCIPERAGAFQSCSARPCDPSLQTLQLPNGCICLPDCSATGCPADSFCWEHGTSGARVCVRACSAGCVEGSSCEQLTGGEGCLPPAPPPDRGIYEACNDYDHRCGEGECVRAPTGESACLHACVLGGPCSDGLQCVGFPSSRAPHCVATCSTFPAPTQCPRRTRCVTPGGGTDGYCAP